MAALFFFRLSQTDTSGVRPVALEDVEQKNADHHAQHEHKDAPATSAPTFLLAAATILVRIRHLATGTHWPIQDLVAEPFRQIAAVAVGPSALAPEYSVTLATALGDNREMIAYLRSAGWVVVKRQVVPDPHAAGATRELMVFQLTVEAWRERNHMTLPENP